MSFCFHCPEIFIRQQAGYLFVLHRTDFSLQHLIVRFYLEWKSYFVQFQLRISTRRAANILTANLHHIVLLFAWRVDTKFIKQFISIKFPVFIKRKIFYFKNKFINIVITEILFHNYICDSWFKFETTYRRNFNNY